MRRLANNRKFSMQDWQVNALYFSLGMGRVISFSVFRSEIRATRNKFVRLVICLLEIAMIMVSQIIFSHCASEIEAKSRFIVLCANESYRTCIRRAWRIIGWQGPEISDQSINQSINQLIN
jgi:hypothetical protein